MTGKQRIYLLTIKGKDLEARTTHATFLASFSLLSRGSSPIGKVE